MLSIISFTLFAENRVKVDAVVSVKLLGIYKHAHIVRYHPVGDGLADRLTDSQFLHRLGQQD